MKSLLLRIKVLLVWGGGGGGSGHPDSEIRGGGDDLKNITLAGDKHTNQWRIQGRDTGEGYGGGGTPPFVALN